MFKSTASFTIFLDLFNILSLSMSVLYCIVIFWLQIILYVFNLLLFHCYYINSKVYVHLAIDYMFWSVFLINFEFLIIDFFTTSFFYYNWFFLLYYFFVLKKCIFSVFDFICKVSWFASFCVLFICIVLLFILLFVMLFFISSWFFLFFAIFFSFSIQFYVKIIFQLFLLCYLLLLQNYHSLLRFTMELTFHCVIRRSMVGVKRLKIPTVEEVRM